MTPITQMQMAGIRTDAGEIEKSVVERLATTNGRERAWAAARLQKGLLLKPARCFALLQTGRGPRAWRRLRWRPGKPLRNLRHLRHLCSCFHFLLQVFAWKATQGTHGKRAS